MTKPMVRFHNIETDEVIDREMTDEEYAIHLEEISKAEIENLKKIEEEEKVKSARAALLNKLGITEEEAIILLTPENPVKDAEKLEENN